MDEFRTIAKLWPAGTEIDLGTDSNNVTVPATFQRHAGDFVTSSDGAHQYRFLFWNTGRHLTNKRRVKWNFSVGGWGVWTATKWYGTPNGPGGSKNVHVEGFAIRDDSNFSETAIDASASTIPSGAYPNGSDKDVSTAKGAVKIAAKSPLHSLIFAQWLQLVFGGEDLGEFVETDTGAAMGTSGFFDVGSGTFDAAQNASAQVLAAYGESAPGGIHKPGLGGVVAGPGRDFPPVSPGDPATWRRIRDFIDELLQKSAPGGSPVDFQSFLEQAPTMNAAELKRAKQAIETTLGLGQTALSTINAQLKKRKG